MRFKEIDTDLLYDCKMMDEGVICRQCYPNDQNIFFISFENFLEQFEESYAGQQHDEFDNGEQGDVGPENDCA